MPGKVSIYDRFEYTDKLFMLIGIVIIINTKAIIIIRKKACLLGSYGIEIKRKKS